MCLFVWLVCVMCVYRVLVCCGVWYGCRCVNIYICVMVCDCVNVCIIWLVCNRVVMNEYIYIIEMMYMCGDWFV